MSDDSDSFDITKIEIFRGKTPDDIKQKCYHLCHKYLAGVWLKVSIDQIEVKRISGGFTNQLYYCAISKPLQPINDEPQEVAIHLYGKKHFISSGTEENERLTDVITALLVSERKLGPKIYGLFESGQIQRYYKHKQFRVNEQKDPNLVKELAIKLARVHAMKVPTAKTGKWILDAYDIFYQIAFEKFPINQLIEECNCQTLKEHDLKQEIEWIKNIILQTNSPIVFCHNDFTASNIMVIEPDSNTRDRLVICDYEYSGYGYRGLDFGTLFSEWGRDMSQFMRKHQFPDESITKPFFQEYIAQSVRIHGKEYSTQEINSIEQLIREAKIFTLVSNLMFTTYVLKTDETSVGLEFNKKNNMRFAEKCYKTYFHRKQSFIDEKLFDN